VAPHPVTIRTYDLGGRKLARELMQTRGENPALGLRGIRLTLARPEIFRTQIRALLRAAADYDIRIMLPMISSLDEIRAFRRFADQLLQELKSEGLACREDYSLGIMIEVPAAAAVADILAREVDFFSIGTNDLVQYTLAVDRNNEEVRNLFQPFHPAVLRLLEKTVAAATDQGIALGLCGEMGGDPLAVPLLVGLGLRRLSVSPRRIPEVKAVLRDLRLADLQQLVKECMALPTGEQVEERLRAFSCASKPAALAAGGSPSG
jgi:phosphotransferase system enzyme I (PtsI)